MCVVKKKMHTNNLDDRGANVYVKTPYFLTFLIKSNVVFAVAAFHKSIKIIRTNRKINKN